MILKKVEKGNVVKAIYKSSNVLASKYDKVSKDLTITFNNGNVYEYSNVSTTDYTRLEIAESQGKILNKYIKQYTFKKGDAIDPNKIIEEVDKHQEEVIKDIELSIVKLMNNISKVYDKKEELNSDDLSKLQFLISKLENEKK